MKGTTTLGTLIGGNIWPPPYKGLKSTDPSPPGINSHVKIFSHSHTPGISQRMEFKFKTRAYRLSVLHATTSNTYPLPRNECSMVRIPSNGFKGLNQRVVSQSFSKLQVILSWLFIFIYLEFRITNGLNT